jgi:indole-3-glycerol phosphate synthase
MSILQHIVEARKRKVEMAMANVPLHSLIEMAKLAPPAMPFADAIKRRDGIKLIAELKRSSPSAGLIREDFDPVRLLSTYEASPASAISVLTEEDFFGGHVEHIKLARALTTKPILRKDFIVHEYQVVEARAYGADAILLIVSILSKSELTDLLALTNEQGMDALVEVHDEAEVEVALSSGAKVIGINNRNLKTMHVDISVTLRLRPLIPDDIVVVSESGIKSREDVRMLEDVGVDAILVGEALMRSEDPLTKMFELLGMVRK